MGPNLIGIVCKSNSDDLTVKSQLCLGGLRVQNLQFAVINHARARDSCDLIEGHYLKA